MEQELQKKLDQATSLLASIDNSNKVSWKTILQKFALGLATALGATLGLAMVLALLGFLIHSFGGVPVIGSWFSSLGQFLQNNNLK